MNYDDIAEMYQRLFKDKASIAENIEVAREASNLIGSIYEVGCGCGLLLDYVYVKPRLYKGVDPSQGMLKYFKTKHSDYKVECARFEDDDEYKFFDNVVATFGSISYVEKGRVQELARTYKGDLFLMFYKENYHPITYEELGVEMEHQKYTMDELKQLFVGKNIYEYHEYIIVTTLSTRI